MTTCCQPASQLKDSVQGMDITLAGYNLLRIANSKQHFMYLITNYRSTLAMFQMRSLQLQLKHHGITAGHKLPWSKRRHIDLSFR